MPHNVKVVPVRLRGYSAELDCDVRRTVAFRAECDCGWKGRSRRTVADARNTWRTHRRQVK